MNLSRQAVEYFRAGPKFHARTALEILSQLPIDRRVGAIAVVRMNLHDTAYAVCSMQIDGHRVLGVVLTSPEKTPEDVSFQSVLRTHLERLAATIAPSSTQPEPDPHALRRFSQPVFYLLNDRYEVESGWHAPDPASIAIATLAEPQKKHLPKFLESPVKRMTSAWDLSNPSTCAISRAYPIPGLLLRTVPMQSESRTLIGVSLEAYAARKTLDHTATQLHISPRERDVLYLMLEGEHVSDIATKLHIADTTVQDHIKRMILKTESRNRIEMAAKVLGWPSVPPQRRSQREADRRGAFGGAARSKS
jgi:DNA-binding CsgD family transcriptional regulator